MTTENNHITAIHVDEMILGDRVNRILVVDTDLEMPASGRIEENDELLDLHNRLEQIAVFDLDTIDEVKIRTAPAA